MVTDTRKIAKCKYKIKEPSLQKKLQKNDVSSIKIGFIWKTKNNWKL